MRKNLRVMSRHAVTSGEILAAIQQGRLTRGQFEAWHLQRRRPSRGFIIATPDRPSSPPRRSPRRHKR
jgi:hypothetical protein